MTGLYDDSAERSSPEKMRQCMSVAYSMGYTMRSHEWPMPVCALAMQIASCQGLLEELEMLYERLTGLSAVGRPWREVLEEAWAIRDARNEIDRLTGSETSAERA
jgi:hypothetical protein